MITTILDQKFPLIKIIGKQIQEQIDIDLNNDIFVLANADVSPLISNRCRQYMHKVIQYRGMVYQSSSTNHQMNY